MSEARHAADYAFDRYLRYDELAAWLDRLADSAPELVTIESYGTSHEGRDLLLATVTDSATGPHDAKPAHWIDASIHAVELTATVAACRVLQHLVDGYRAGVEQVTRALRTRTFYVVPRVNPDGAEWALADRPRFRRSSTRPWPDTDGRRWPGLHAEDIDGDGRILEMRVEDPDGPWTTHPEDTRLLVPVPPSGAASGATRYRLLREGTIEDHDGFTIPQPRPPEGLDLNRNFPAGWGTTVRGSGDHPLSEPEIDALVRAIVARPNVCGYNAFHTSGGVLLRPSSTAADSTLPAMDLWTWKHLAERGTELTGYPSHSVYEDFTFDRSDSMSGAADDWAYEHLGVFGWTTEFWDIVHAATGTKASTHFWYTGPTDAEALAVLRWLDDQPGDALTAGFVDWYPFDHPQLGAVELGGWNDLHSWVNPPLHLLAREVEGHAQFAVEQALAAPRVEIRHTAIERLQDSTRPEYPTPEHSTWRVTIGVANTGWLPTNVTERATKEKIAREVVAELRSADGADRGDVDVLDGHPRRRLGQLDGARTARFGGPDSGTPDRALCTWLVRAAVGTTIELSVRHHRAGRDVTTEVLE